MQIECQKDSTCGSFLKTNPKLDNSKLGFNSAMNTGQMKRLGTGLISLISLNNPLFKNIPHNGSLWHFLICCICVFVYLCICEFVFSYVCVKQLAMKPIRHIRGHTVITVSNIKKKSENSTAIAGMLSSLSISASWHLSETLINI